MNTNQPLDSHEDLLDLLFRKWKILLGVTLVAMILGALLSGPYFIRQKYKSTAVIYATTTPSISQALAVKDNPYRKSVLEFGEEEETEQLLQLLQSTSIRDSIIKEFNLAKHYRLNPDDPKYLLYLHTLYDEHFSFNKNSYLAINVEVQDYSRDTAALIANRVVELLDIAYTQVRRKRSQEALDIMEEHYAFSQQQIAALEAKNAAIFEKGYLSSERQLERLMEQLGIALRTGDMAGAKRLRAELSSFGALAPQVLEYEESVRWFYKDLDLLRQHINNIRTDNTHSMSSKFVISAAEPALKKHYPIRWLIVLAAGAGVFVLMLFYFRLKEAFQSRMKVLKEKR